MYVFLIEFDGTYYYMYTQYASFSHRKLTMVEPLCKKKSFLFARKSRKLSCKLSTSKVCTLRKAFGYFLECFAKKIIHENIGYVTHDLLDQLFEFFDSIKHFGRYFVF